jgi:hypothetical protein
LFFVFQIVCLVCFELLPSWTLARDPHTSATQHFIILLSDIKVQTQLKVDPKRFQVLVCLCTIVLLPRGLGCHNCRETVLLQGLMALVACAIH